MSRTPETRERVYVVAGCKPWNREVFEESVAPRPGRWHFVATKDGLSVASIHDLRPRYIFFLHWSWRVPDELLDHYECVCFHMADVPYGRGGSPLQNLILAGHRQTKLTALRMVRELDAGPIYMKEDLSLEGSAEEIYVRATRQSARMIAALTDSETQPVPQTGEPVVFKRRRPEESEIPEATSLQALHDFVRMLDAAGYPKAFLVNKGFRYELNRAVLYHGRVMADVTITKLPRPNDENPCRRGAS